MLISLILKNILNLVTFGHSVSNIFCSKILQQKYVVGNISSKNIEYCFRVKTP